ncbi:enamine deaminase RidA (YjgF/YER057c/UK114 family) [Enteractinococcus coprophilus]|uniref:Enamine deaminase RidA (YjgF/YER057c/UK114 family) n=2 Tax=Enteractinococcus coprophilus TaxID=1027633 RepID=A0A543AF63_9MICC|nr:enamine deaminase RidA (YjgF/YER057c/UK114 family) [Enteractinococcus coprophilus]
MRVLAEQTPTAASTGFVSGGGAQIHEKLEVPGSMMGHPMNIQHLNPAGLHTNPAFSQGVVVGAEQLVVVGGQQGTDSAGNVIAADLRRQTQQALRHVLTVLAEVGADASHVVKLNIFLDGAADAQSGYVSAFEVWGAHPTAVTVVQIAGFSRPGVLVEIDALAVVPDNSNSAGWPRRRVGSLDNVVTIVLCLLPVLIVLSTTYAQRYRQSWRLGLHTTTGTMLRSLSAVRTM